jgi:GNAT superfamily N-acetyltransferase
MSMENGGATPMAPETTTYLEMLSPAELVPPRADPSRLAVRRLAAADFELGRRLYREVGAAYLWLDRLAWSDARWQAWYGRSGVELWIGEADRRPAGYFELDAQPDGNTELAYFGLLPDAIGRGLGGLLLSAAITRAWATGAKRVWVHTSSRDHAAALPNYLARGFRVYRTETKLAPLQPAPAAGPRA